MKSRFLFTTKTFIPKISKRNGLKYQYVPIANDVKTILIHLKLL